jgi:hypothetical protein
VDARRPTQVLLAGPAGRSHPQTLTYPTETFASNTDLHIAVLTLQTADFEPGESATATVYFEPSSHALFGGDLTGNHVTPALIEGNSCRQNAQDFGALTCAVSDLLSDGKRAVSASKSLSRRGLAVPG